MLVKFVNEYNEADYVYVIIHNDVERVRVLLDDSDYTRDAFIKGLRSLGVEFTVLLPEDVEIVVD